MSIVTIALILSNWRASVLGPDTPISAGTVFLEEAFWILTGLLIFWDLIVARQMRVFFQEINRNWPLVLFIGFAVISVFWTVSLPITSYKVLVLIFSSLAGAYLGLRFDIRRLLDYLWWFGVVFVIFSFLLAILLPAAGRMLESPYDGAWQGIYWHKNHLGGIAALINSVFLIRSIWSYLARKPLVVLDILFYLSSGVLIYLSSSAGAYIVAILLHVSIAAFMISRQFRLRPVHYYIGAGLGIIAAVAVLGNLDRALGLFNRNATLTGRIPLWEFLLRDTISQRPWFGYGFGALWNLETFQTRMQGALGWRYPIVIADNGFMDILLHLGLVGLVLFLIVYGSAWIKAVRGALAHRSVADFFPVIFMLFTLLGNISFSFFLETESFVWMWMISLLFLMPSADKELTLSARALDVNQGP
jgi:exopolysaccharide production protein ExoQ